MTEGNRNSENKTQDTNHEVQLHKNKKICEVKQTIKNMKKIFSLSVAHKPSYLEGWGRTMNLKLA